MHSLKILVIQLLTDLVCVLVPSNFFVLSSWCKAGHNLFTMTGEEKQPEIIQIIHLYSHLFIFWQHSQILLSWLITSSWFNLEKQSHLHIYKECMEELQKITASHFGCLTLRMLALLAFSICGFCELRDKLCSVLNLIYIMQQML